MIRESSQFSNIRLGQRSCCFLSFSHLRPVAGVDLLCEKNTTDSWWLMLIRYEIKDTAGWLADKPTEQSKNRVNFSSVSAEI